MPKYRVTGPDGQSQIVDMPDGTSPDDVLARFTQRSANTNTQLQSQGAGNIGTAKVSKMESAARGAVQGATFNWGDEIYGYGKNLPKLISDPENYYAAAQHDTALERQNNKYAAYQNPLSYGGAELAGTAAPMALSYLASGLSGGAAAPAAAATTARAASMGSKMWSAAKAGAVGGGIMGAGAAESPEDADRTTIATNTALGTAGGALLGGAVGTALPPAAKAIGATAGLITKPLQSMINPERFAASKLAEALQRGNKGMSASDIEQAAITQGQNAPGSVVADIGGDPMRKLFRAGMDQPNAETESTLKWLAERQKLPFQTIEDKMITPNFGDPKTYSAAREAIFENRNAKAGPAFKDSFDSSFEPHPDLMNTILSRPSLFAPVGSQKPGAIVRDMAKYFETRHGVDYQPSDLEAFHQAKVRIDKLINWDRSSPDMAELASAVNMDQGALKALRGELVDGIAKSRGEGPQKYLAAVKQYGSESDVARAMQDGYKHGRGEMPEGINEALNGAPQAVKDGYRLGVGRAKYEQNLSGKYGVDRIARDWDGPLIDQQLQAALPPAPPPNASGQSVPGPLDRIQQVKDALNNQTSLRQEMIGNSKTAAYLRAQEDAGKDAEQVVNGVRMAVGAAGGNFSPLIRMGEHALARAQGMSPRVSAEVLRLGKTPIENIGGLQGWQLDPAVRSLIQDQANWASQKPAMFRSATRGLLGPATGENGSTP